ncbi:MAG TPA: biotin/lipoyl-containing protein [Gemmatimonadales bacterium]|nr:biotin/lipoyl-containing protein [Gemmatimonadales bacterium]
MKYHVSLNGRDYEVQIDGETVRVDGRPVSAALEMIVGTPLRLLTLDRRSLSLAALPEGAGRWTLLDRGEAVAVEVLDERSRHIRSMVGAGRAHASGAVIRAPMPGLVVQVLAQVGATVTPGAGLVILEAMKMENELKAPVAGTVLRVAAAPGQSVEKGQVLVELE